MYVLEALTQSTYNLKIKIKKGLEYANQYITLLVESTYIIAFSRDLMQYCPQDPKIAVQYLMRDDDTVEL